ncbi:tRNA uridine-5-carboxymethylaminomethyl(34) synthesis GTPase MnmE [Croceitalea sp. P059]|uniref:tRNA uridine-5-carboxymethylaminomethyl(34) synthesis GTPase MnmE n=1 Tax=Croceitalea sp. P059 TaxID=3075601 RepID=UPI002887EAE6|nr:tRNA uridine-5-carboxymethylaminomethyl(34) synthesis GTPase MnmE [Croceitalea sp. P059]MDT0539472.1 tRNA uridine-5-carboxymethylaminomethyl(34) synthesis GTPase MnmE [Croceitalea sp. P059]
MTYNDNIIALASASGTGAIAVIRISGINAIEIVAKQFKSVRNKNLTKQKTHTIHLGHIIDENKIIDKVLVSIFKAPNSYTGENVAEISCHGSPYIQQQIIQLFLRNGCKAAQAGEFTLRAFLNGKMDLSQAEAVADLIASDSEASHQIAMQQMRGGFSNEISNLRQELLNFASLIELELDFSQEDVEFADRTQFNELLSKITELLKKLIDSFALGNVIKNGIPVAIIGEPNVGKSTLLNTLLNEERAIVSDIPGTTRDTVEDQITIGGINFRFIDTAGIRDTNDKIEQIGITKAFEKVEQARLVIYLFEAKKDKHQAIEKIQKDFPDKKILLIANKIDEIDKKRQAKLQSRFKPIQLVSAKTGIGINNLKEELLKLSNTGELGKDDTIVTNSRHYDALFKALEAIQKVKDGIEVELSSDLMTIDIREALYHLGEITGSVTTDDLLGNIFSNFCIGK